MEEYSNLEEIMNELFREEDLNKADIEVLFEEWDSLQHKVLTRLVNTKWNEKRLVDLPHKEILDLSVIFYVPMFSTEERCVSSVITYSMMENWGIGLNELWNAAVKNINESDSFSILGIEDVIADATGIDVTRKSFVGIMYVATNVSKFYGASVLLRMDLLEEFADGFHKNFYIIPSSIHELVLVPDNGLYDVDSLKQILQEMNIEIMRPYERLSDNIYFFDREKREVKML